MENTSDTPKQKKRGPVKRGYDHAHILLPPYLIEWAKEQPEGLSALARELLIAEHRRREAVSA